MLEQLGVDMPNESNLSDSSSPSLSDLITLKQASQLSGLSPSHLRLLVSRGDIWGVKLGRNWVTTFQAVKEYLAQDRRTGPKSKAPRDQISS